ncbi:MAG TPA: preprotein translocase subunit SecG [Syntrophomonadaceae bacterium]|nr:preprotein translocase subunit SecG [Syntrophomonadaceae bacterium]
MAKTIVLVFQVLLGIGLITVILLQSGKSAGLSGSIAGGSEALFGSKSKGIDEFLSKVTGYVAAGFIIANMVLALL